MANKTFFNDVEDLVIPEVYVAVEEESSGLSASELIKRVNIQTGFVIVHTIYDMQIGYVQQGELLFAKAGFDYEKGAKQIRIFNKSEELLLKKLYVDNEDEWYVRHVVEKDESIEGFKLDYIDDASPIIGKKIYNEEQIPGFVLVVEESRKISHYLPVKSDSTRYEIVMRSYIQKDEETGQAGYGFNRYVSITPLLEIKGGGFDE